MTDGIILVSVIGLTVTTILGIINTCIKIIELKK